MHLARLSRLGPVDKFFMLSNLEQSQLLSLLLEAFRHVTGLATIEAERVLVQTELQVLPAHGAEVRDC